MSVNGTQREAVSAPPNATRDRSGEKSKTGLSTIASVAAVIARQWPWQSPRPSGQWQGAPWKGDNGGSAMLADVTGIWTFCWGTGAGIAAAAGVAS